MRKTRLPGCYAVVTSGVPPREPLFNGSICFAPQHNAISNLMFSGEGGSNDALNSQIRTVAVTAPALLKRYVDTR